MAKQLRIFVVDDDPDLGRTTEMVLKKFGHEPHVFRSAETALSALENLTPDVILSDIGMPQMDGCELARRLKQRPDCQNVVLAAVTGLEDDQHRKDAVEAGFDYRFVKPLSPVELHDFLDQIQSDPTFRPARD